MKYLNKLKRLISSNRELKKIDSELKNNTIIEISFTGGMGAQILSAAIYFDLQSQGYEVTADLTYFDHQPHVANEGVKGEISLWDWQLDEYALPINKFRNSTDIRKKRIKHLPDGALKTLLGITALQKQDIRKHFNLISLLNLQPLAKSNLKELSEPYLCIHIRRGDYLNVASYLVPDEHFLQLCKRFSHLINSIVIVSDSKISNDFKNKLSNQFSFLLILDGASESPFVTHSIMRHSAILVSSNSQFSFTAGALNQGLVVLPKVWIGKGHFELKKQLEKLSNFVLLN